MVTLLIVLVVTKRLRPKVSRRVMAGCAVLRVSGLTVWIYRATVVVCD